MLGNVKVKVKSAMPFFSRLPRNAPHAFMLSVHFHAFRASPVNNDATSEYSRTQLPWRENEQKGV